MFTTKNLIILIGKQSVFAFVAVAVAFTTIFLLSREINRTSNAVVQNQQLSEKLAKRTELFSAIAHDVAIVGANGPALENAFLSTDNILEFVSALESIALKNNAAQSFSFGNPLSSSITQPFIVSTVSYENNVALNIFSFITYLKDFEKLPYYTKINNISFSSQNPDGWRGGGSAALRATLYTKTNN